MGAAILHEASGELGLPMMCVWLRLVGCDDVVAASRTCLAVAALACQSRAVASRVVSSSVASRVDDSFDPVNPC